MAATAGETAPQWPELLPWQTSIARQALAARATWPHAILLDGPRGVRLDAKTRDAARLLRGMRAIAACDAAGVVDLESL